MSENQSDTQLSVENKKLEPRQVLICQGRSCRKYGSQRVLAALKDLQVSRVEIVESGCLGQCGNGPIVLVEPEHIWYWRVNADDVPCLSEQHLRQHYPVTRLLYPKFHPNF